MNQGKLVEVRVPGSVYYECFDPMATEYPREVNLPKPQVVKVGRGWQFRYAVSPELAEDMIEAAELFGEAMSYGVDDPTAGRIVLRWVERERERLSVGRAA